MLDIDFPYTTKTEAEQYTSYYTPEGDKIILYPKGALIVFISRKEELIIDYYGQARGKIGLCYSTGESGGQGEKVCKVLGTLQTEEDGRRLYVLK